MSKIIGLSNAHYPAAAGAHSNGFYEHQESIIWTSIVRKHLLDKGYTVVVAPIGRLPQKVRWLNKQKPVVAVEIHFNGSSNPHVNGCETLYHPNSRKGRELALRTHFELAKVMDNNNRGVKEGWYRMDAPGRIDYIGDVDGDEHPDYFLARTNCPAIIIEPEFISNVRNITVKRWEASAAIAKGIDSHLNITFKPTGL